MNLSGKKIAILATNGSEQAELEVPVIVSRKPVRPSMSFRSPPAKSRAGTRTPGRDENGKKQPDQGNGLSIHARS